MAGYDGLRVCLVELVNELFRRGVGVEELCRQIGASSLGRAAQCRRQ